MIITDYPCMGSWCKSATRRCWSVCDWWSFVQWLRYCLRIPVGLLIFGRDIHMLSPMGILKVTCPFFLTRLNVLLASKNFQIFLLISAVEQIVSFDRVGMTDPHQGFRRPDIAGQTRGDKYLLSLFTTFISPLSVLPTWIATRKAHGLGDSESERSHPLSTAEHPWKWWDQNAHPRVGVRDCFSPFLKKIRWRWRQSDTFWNDFVLMLYRTVFSQTVWNFFLCFDHSDIRYPALPPGGEAGRRYSLVTVGMYVS